MNTSLGVSNEARLLVLLTLLNLKPTEKDEITRLFRSPLDFKRFDHLARVNGHRPWILYQLESLGHLDRLPAALRAEWARERDGIRKRLEQRFVHARTLFQKFNQAGISFAILKGTALAHQIYLNPFYKKSNDIDILIHPDDLPEIYRIYEELGFVAFGERVDKKKSTQEKVAWHATPYVSRDLTLVMGTQWGIKTLLGPYRVEYEGLWNRIENLDFQGVPAKTLAPEDTLLHLCLHLGFFKTQLKDLIDITNLLRFYGGRFPYDDFVELAIRAGASSHAYHALSLSNRLDPMPEVERMLNRFRPRAWRHYREAAQKKTESLDDFLEFSVDWIQRVEILMTLFMSAEGFSRKMREFFELWRVILLPPRKDMLKMSFVREAGFFETLTLRVKTPFRILRALAEELGWKLVGLLALKTGIDLTRSLGTVFRRETPARSPYAKLAQELGKSEDEIVSFLKEFV